MKKILVSFVAMMFMFAPMVFSASIDDFDYTVGSGDYLGTFVGNDSNTADLNAALATLGMAPGSLNLFDKIDLPLTSSSVMTITSTDDWLSGTWSTTPIFVDYYSVKAGNYFSLYKLDPALASGIWTTYNISEFIGGERLATRALSHFSTWDPSTPVPEPSTLLLFGAGIAGLAMYRRKRS